MKRQIENGRAFANSKGWRVSDAHVYADDAISGAETRKLVNRRRLLDVIAAGAPFQVLYSAATGRTNILPLSDKGHFIPGTWVTLRPVKGGCHAEGGSRRGPVGSI